MAAHYAAISGKEDGQNTTFMPDLLPYSSYRPQASEEGSTPPFLPRPSRHRRQFELLELLKNVCLPMVAIAYFSFCYTVHNRIVPVSAARPSSFGELDQTTIKSATTAISIIVIGLGLFPIKSLIQDLRNEEFFRVLSSRPNGVPLSTVNIISTAAAGNTDAVRAITARRSSSYFIIAFAAGLLTIVVTTLAPSALSVANVLVDGDVLALTVGAIPANSVLNVSDFEQIIFDVGQKTVEDNAPLAGNVAWAEWSLGARYKYLNPGFNSSDEEMYIVPTPRGLPQNAYARWISDVLHLKPECTWANTNVSQGINLGTNFTDAISMQYTIELDGGLSVQLSPADISVFKVALTVLKPTNLINTTTLDAAPAGTTVFAVYQQISPTLSAIDAAVRFNLDGLPAFDVIATDKTIRIAFLFCHPHATIGPGIIRSEAGKLFMEPTPPRLRRHGNLHVAQSNFLLSFAMKSIDKAGPAQVGRYIASSDMVASIVFGTENVDRALNLTLTRDFHTWTPRPMDDITRSYASLLQSATKEYMGGMLGTQNVPARIATPTLIFTSSLPLTIVAFVVFSLLCVLLAVAQFRKGKGDSFTFYSVAAALEGSAIPGQFSRAKKEGIQLDQVGVGLRRGNSVHRKEEDYWQAEAAKLGARPLLLERDPVGGMRLHLG